MNKPLEGLRVTLTKTCEIFPAQWEGVTEDGRSVYVRYRWDTLVVGIGPDRDSAVENAVLGVPAFVSEGPFESCGEMSNEELASLTGMVITDVPRERIYLST